jgi:molecular chaperone DnaK (HSP70)
MASPRFAIGIDLGTTNCSLAYVPLDLINPEVQLLPIPQWEGENQIISDVRLPSFAWILPKSLIKQQTRHMPWHGAEDRITTVLGREAKFRALAEADRVAFAAKSWMSVGALSTRQAPILPWGSAVLVGDERLSPVTIQSLLLSHLRDAWNASFASEAPFHEQRIVITVPASFDDVAQRLTLEAAKLAAYPESLELLEEPQAAFYDWYALLPHPEHLKTQKIAVCDVGGGTCDFTLLSVQGQISGEPHIDRLRVSEHLLLGGDNIDLALAEALKLRMGVGELPRHSWHLLLAQSRSLKEEVLSHEGEADAIFHVSVPLQAQQLFGNHASASITRAEIQTLLIEGFFPRVSSDSKPEKTKNALRSFGLPYVQDTAITRHLAAFLQGTEIDALLCAGGTLMPRFLRRHLQTVLESWQVGKAVPLLEQPHPDLAIARGAAWYAWQRHKGQTLVTSHFPRSVFLELGTDSGQNHYLCLIPRGHARGQVARLEPEGLHLRVGQAVSFHLYSTLEAASLVQHPDPDWQALPPLTLELKAQQAKDQKAQLVPVALEALVRETGVLELSCRSLIDSTQSWSLDFALEGPSRPDTAIATGISPSASTLANREQAQSTVRQSFSKNQDSDSLRVSQLPKRLEDILGLPREDWPVPLLREIWDTLEEGLHRRQKSLEHEASWLYLAGFCLRPGWGAARDPQRVRLLWTLFDHGWNKQFAQDKRLENQWWLLWRRIAGGLDGEQQRKILDRILPTLRKDKDAAAEMIRLAATLEKAPMEKKIQLGRLFTQQLLNGVRDQLDARMWALARLASRYPWAAGPEAVVPAHIVEEWAEQLKALPWPSKSMQKLTLFYQLGGRMRGEPALDIDPDYRRHFIERLETAGIDKSQIEPVRSFQERSSNLDLQLFGEALPSGFVLRHSR